MIAMLARNWWAFVARGIFAILFGLIALFTPGVTMLSLVLVFAVFSGADGVMALISAIHAAGHGERWSILGLEGIAGIIIGAAAAALPAVTLVVFVALIAAWAIITGSFMLAAGFQMDADHGRWWLVLGGGASLVFGAGLVTAPLMGALILTWWVGAYAIIAGVSLLAAAFKLRAKFKHSLVGKLA
jgi:uncharacterized membrane protein HdeD (DUF308 family)